MYVELHCHSSFSLLDGAALPEMLAARAADLGHPALALTDHDELGGAVRFAQATAEVGIGGIIGAELTIAGSGTRDEGRGDSDCDCCAAASRIALLSDALQRPASTRPPPAGTRPLPSTLPASRFSLPAHHLVLLAETREGYGNLATLITRARMENPRGEPRLTLDMLAQHARGLFALTGCPRGWVPSLVAAGELAAASHAAATLLDIFDQRVAIECWDHGLAEEREMVRGLIDIARALDVPWVVTNDVHYARARDRIVHDVLSCLRHNKTLDEMGTRLRPSGEWYLKSAAQMRRRWQHAPQGIAATLAVAERCVFRMEQLEPTLPSFPLPPGVTADEYLERLVIRGAEERWRGSTETHQRQVEHELNMIRRLGLAGYFLIVWDIVRFARREGILCQGRGSAANSAVCYCLGITAVDPIRLGLLFERFLSEERREAPDIDIDFAHRERERVIQYVYEKYGREHAAMVCEQITYRGRSAVRDAARVLGFSVEQADRLATLSDRFSARATADALRGKQEADSGMGEDGKREETQEEMIARVRADDDPRHRGNNVGPRGADRSAERWTHDAGRRAHEARATREETSHRGGPAAAERRIRAVRKRDRARHAPAESTLDRISAARPAGVHGSPRPGDA